MSDKRLRVQLLIDLHFADGDSIQSGAQGYTNTLDYMACNVAFDGRKYQTLCLSSWLRRVIEPGFIRSLFESDQP